MIPDFYARGPHPFLSRRLNEFRKMLLIAMTASTYANNPRDGVPERVDREVDGITAALMTYTPAELAGFLGGGQSPEAVADIETVLLADKWAELTECFPFGIEDKTELAQLAARSSHRRYIQAVNLWETAAEHRYKRGARLLTGSGKSRLIVVSPRLIDGGPSVRY